MSESRRVKVLDCTYNQEKDLIIWHFLLLENEDEIRLASQASLIGAAFGIESTIPPEALVVFCNKIKGKEVNWVGEGIVQASAHSMTTEEMESAAYELGKLEHISYGLGQHPSQVKKDASE